MFHDDYLPPFETETENIVDGREESEEVNSTLVVIKDKLGEEVMDDHEEFKTLMKSYFNDMTMYIMQGFEFMAIQLGGKLVVGGSSSSHHEGKKTYWENVTSKTGAQNRPHEFKN